MRGGCEPAVLDRHVSKKVSQIPSGTRGRAPKVGKPDGVDDVDGGKDGAAMGTEEIGG